MVSTEPSSTGCPAFRAASIGAAPAASTPMMRARLPRPRRPAATPASNPPPPTGTSTVAGARHFVGELQADRALTGDHELIVEGWDVESAPARLHTRGRPAIASSTLPGTKCTLAP